jgi:hypothetical protein
MAIIAAITVTMAQTKEAYKKAIIKKVKKDIKAFNRKNTMFITN